MGEETVERPFEIAAVVGHSFGNEGEDAWGDIEPGMMLSGGRRARLEYFKTQLFAERSHFDPQPAGKARAHSLFQAFEIGRRTIGGHHGLAARIDERVERMAELGLGRLALQ